MQRLAFLFLISSICFSACEPLPAQYFDEDGNPLPHIYRISANDVHKIRFRMLDSINVLRQARGSHLLVIDEHLTAAAATHSRDISSQNRAWHFGSDGSSPFIRVARAKFTGTLLGELIAETYEAELHVLAVWLTDKESRAILLDNQATRMGFAWHQERNGKIWWTLITGKYDTSMVE
ncbi:MAG: CAP domain-containing protein [Aestuariivita sp.]|nr:CAP domain-containing protein [Aestuariivita sp.]